MAEKVLVPALNLAMMLSPSRFSCPLLVLGGVLFWVAPPTQAQPKTKPARVVKSAPVSQTSLPIALLLGVGAGGIAIGAALGASLKKKPVETKAEAVSAIFDDAALPLAIVDAQERIVRANPAWNSFFGAQTSPNQPLAPFFHPDDLAPTRDALIAIFEGERASWTGQTRFFRPDGALLTCEVHCKRQGDGRKSSAVLMGLIDASQLVETRAALDGSREAIRALYEVMAGEKSSDLDAKMKSLLAMGAGRFKLPIAVLGRFNRDPERPERGEFYETLFVQSNDRRVRPALQIGLKAPQTLESALLGLDLWRGGVHWQEQPFLSANEKIALLGAPVVVEGQPFGLLSFADLAPREGDWEAGEIELLQLMAEWVGGEIERENARVALENQQKALLDANDKLEALATHDPLTGAKNRRAFDEKLAEEWSRAARYGTPLSLVMMDVDKFKLYNDSFGHQAGDEVLRKVARAVAAGIRGTDFFARYGGEEFALILPNTDLEGAMILAERLRVRIESAPWTERAVTASVGVSSIGPEFGKAEELLGAADAALYSSKDRGRNRVTHASEIAAVGV